MKKTLSVLLVLLSILSLTSALYAIGLPPPPDKPPAVEPTNSPTPDLFLSPLIPAGPFLRPIRYTWYDGTSVTESAFRAEFGAFQIHSCSSCPWQVCELRAVSGPATLAIRVEPGMKVIFCWPDAPLLTGAGWLEQGIIGVAKEDGNAEFAMGHGAFYFPPNSGPHQVWVYGEGQSDMLTGIGMLGGTNHNHFDAVYCKNGGPITPTITIFIPMAERFTDN